MFNPYQSIGPLTSMGLPAASATAGIAKTGINWASLLTNTQKTLNIVNQAIPLVYQVKPIVNNAKTIFKVANELNKTIDELKELVKLNRFPWMEIEMNEFDFDGEYMEIKS